MKYESFLLNHQNAKKQKPIAEICHFVNNCFQNKAKMTAKSGSPHKMKGTTKTAVPIFNVKVIILL